MGTQVRPGAFLGRHVVSDIPVAAFCFLAFVWLGSVAALLVNRPRAPRDGRKEVAMNKQSWLAVAISLALVCSLAGSAGATQYYFHDLGTLGGADSQANAINSSSQIVGAAQNASGYWRAFSLSPGQPMQDLGTLYGNNSSANAINASGQITGSSGGHSDYYYYAFLKNPGQPMEDLLGRISMGRSINASGQIVGGYDFSAAFLKNPGQPMQDLGNLGGGDSNALWINASGQIVGYSRDGSGNLHAFLVEPGGTMQNLGTLPGSTSSQALAINNNGQIVGTSNHAFLKNPGQPMQDLGTLGGDAAASSINDIGQIVGYSQIGDGTWHAFLVNPGEAMQDLNALALGLPSGVALMQAFSINDNGWIVGRTTGDYTHAFLLTPVPVPGSLLLFGSGLVGLLSLMRWRNRKVG